MFAGAGNIATCNSSNDAATAALLDGMNGFVFTTGDNAFPGGAAADYANCYQPSWGRHLSRTIPALGNHEYDAGNASGAFGYFGSRLPNAPNGWYSADIGDWHVVVLNDNLPISAGSPQEQWLRADLAANPRQCTIALWHQPRFFSSNSAGWTSRSASLAVWNALQAAGVDVVVNGHSYHYERMAPMRPDGTRDDAGGIRQFNAGTGGYALQMPTAAVHPNSEARAAVHGVLKLTLSAGSYSWEFVPVAGQGYSDSGSGACH